MHWFTYWFDSRFPRQQRCTILLGVSPALLAIGIPLSAAAGIIVATGVVHTFLGYIPSALIGAPGADTLYCYQVTECYSLEMRLRVLHILHVAVNWDCSYLYRLLLQQESHSVQNWDGMIP